VSSRDLVRVAFCAALTCILAWLYIPLPFTPVPLTGQTLGCMLSGGLVGARRGAASQLLYVGLGRSGRPGDTCGV